MGSVNHPDFWPMQEGINEIIATTRYNAAPMGIICRDGRLKMAIYRTSHTAGNLEKYPYFIANIIHDPVLFVQSAFSDLMPGDYMKVEVNGETLFRLSSAQSWIAYTATIEHTTDLKILVSLEPIRYAAEKMTLIPVNRGFNNIIEATVHGTRYLMNHDPKLKNLIDHHADLVKRCGSERDLIALSKLYEYLRVM